MAERVGDKALVGHFWLVQIATGNACAANVQLADNPDRNRLQLLIQHVDQGIGNRTANVQRAARCHRPGGRYHRGFSRAVIVDHRKAGVAVELTQAVAADQQRAQRRVLPRTPERLFSHRRRQEADL